MRSKKKKKNKFLIRYYHVFMVQYDFQWIRLFRGLFNSCKKTKQKQKHNCKIAASRSTSMKFIENKMII